MTFVEAWNSDSSRTVRDVAKKLGKPYNPQTLRRLCNRASKLRSNGRDMKRYPGSGNYGGYPPEGEIKKSPPPVSLFDSCNAPPANTLCYRAFDAKTSGHSDTDMSNPTGKTDEAK